MKSVGGSPKPNWIGDYSELVRNLIGETDAICAEAAEMGHVGLVELRP